MAKATRICKVCGKEYEYCKTWLSENKFRWQDVACSPECGAKYFALIEASRKEKPAETIAERPQKNEPVETIVERPQKNVTATPKKKTYRSKRDDIE